MQNRRSKLTIALAFLTILFTTTAFANSSWHWLTDKRPYELLPLAIVFTLLIEFVIIYFVNKPGKWWFVLGIIIVANLASFLLPYLFLSDGALEFTRKELIEKNTLLFYWSIVFSFHHLH